jgi:sec-independent protein translocase protein TatB
MLDISLAEVVLITAIALVVLGPAEMPKVLLSLGRALRWIKQHLRSADQALERLVDAAELQEYQKKAEERARNHDYHHPPPHD